MCWALCEPGNTASRKTEPWSARAWTTVGSRCLLSASCRVIGNVPRPWEVGVGEGISKRGQRGVRGNCPSPGTPRRSPEKAHFGATEETFLRLVLACSAGRGGAESCNMKSINAPENPPVEPVL